MIVIDEADRMLDLGFHRDIGIAIYRYCVTISHNIFCHFRRYFVRNSRSASSSSETNGNDNTEVFEI